jgi:2,3-bisphosphoglycerate-dependent phosphoglycerate mutase
MVEGRWSELGSATDPEAFRASVVQTLDEIVEGHPGRRVAVVCHGAVINVYLAEVIRTDRVLWFEPAYTSISRILASRSGIRSVLSVNELAHLR